MLCLRRRTVLLKLLNLFLWKIVVTVATTGNYPFEDGTADMELLSNYQTMALLKLLNLCLRKATVLLTLFLLKIIVLLKLLTLFLWKIKIMPK